MGNKQYCLIFLLHVLNNLVNDIPSSLRQGSCCFINDENPWIRIQCSYNFNQFSFFQTVFYDRIFRMNIVNSDFFKCLSCFLIHLFSVNNTMFCKQLLFSDKKIICYFNSRKCSHFLGNHTDSMILCIQCVCWFIWFSVQSKLSFRLRINSGNNRGKS